MGSVHIEQSDCSAALWRQADDATAAEYEMFAPDILTGVEQCDECTCFGIDTHQIRSFVCVTTITGEREVVWIVSTAVLLGHNMLDVKWDEWGCFLRDAAILTNLARTPSDKLSRAGVHCVFFRQTAFPGIAALSPV